MNNNGNVITPKYQSHLSLVSVEDYKKVKVKSFLSRTLHACENSKSIIVRGITYLIKKIALWWVFQYTYDAFKMRNNIHWLPAINAAIRFTRNDAPDDIQKLNIIKKSKLNENNKEVAKNFILDLVKELFTQNIENKAANENKVHINVEALDYEIMKNHLGGLTKKEFYSETIKAFDFCIRYFQHQDPKLNLTANIIVPQDDSFDKSFSSILNDINQDLKKNLAQISEETNKCFAEVDIKPVDHTPDAIAENTEINKSLEPSPNKDNEAQL